MDMFEEFHLEHIQIIQLSAKKLFEYYSKKMAACFENGICKDPDSLVKYSQSRLRVIAMATQKKDKIEDILDKVNEKEQMEKKIKTAVALKGKTHKLL